MQESFYLLEDLKSPEGFFSWDFQMNIFQDGNDLGRVKHFRKMRTQGMMRCIFETNGETAVALDTERTATLVDANGDSMTLRPTKSFYSWGSFRVHGVILDKGDASESEGAVE